MTEINKNKKTILATLLMLPLLTIGISSGGIQNAYAGAPLVDQFCGTGLENVNSYYSIGLSDHEPIGQEFVPTVNNLPV